MAPNHTLLSTCAHKNIIPLITQMRPASLGHPAFEELALKPIPLFLLPQAHRLTPSRMCSATASGGVGGKGMGTWHFQAPGHLCCCRVPLQREGRLTLSPSPLHRRHQSRSQPCALHTFLTRTAQSILLLYVRVSEWFVCSHGKQEHTWKVARAACGQQEGS